MTAGESPTAGRSPARRLAAVGLRVPLVNRAVLAAGAARGNALALVYHRVRPRPAAPHEVVPCVPLALFRQQVRALAAAGDVVDLPALLQPRRGSRPRFALTFDDDYADHLAHAVPVLQELGVPATFFLSGRSLHGSGPYWWEALEHRLAGEGLAATARHLDLPPTSPRDLARRCQADPPCQEHLLASAPERAARHLATDDIRALALAGMRVGFHTVDHSVMTRLDSAQRQHALTHGREALATVAGQPLELFAYPHGKTDPVTTAQTRLAGFTAAWTGQSRAICPGDDPWQLARWEPGPVDPRTLLVKAAARLARGGLGG